MDTKTSDQCMCLNKMFSQPQHIHANTHTHTHIYTQSSAAIKYENELLLRQFLDLFQPTNEASNLS